MKKFTFLYAKSNLSESKIVKSINRFPTNPGFSVFKYYFSNIIGNLVFI